MVLDSLGVLDCIETNFRKDTRYGMGDKRNEGYFTERSQASRDSVNLICFKASKACFGFSKLSNATWYKPNLF